MGDVWEGFSSSSDEETLFPKIATLRDLSTTSSTRTLNEVILGVPADPQPAQPQPTGFGDIARLLCDTSPLISREEELKSEWKEVKPKEKKKQPAKKEKPKVVSSYKPRFSSTSAYARHFLEKIAFELNELRIIQDKILSKAKFVLDLSGTVLIITVKVIEDFSCGDLLMLYPDNGREPVQRKVTDMDEESRLLEVELPQELYNGTIVKATFENSYLFLKMAFALNDFTPSNPSASVVLGSPETVKRGPVSIPFPSGSLNPSQALALRKAETRSFSLIVGPPGSGKTRTAASIVSSFVQAEKNVLVCASSNIAADQLAIHIYRTTPNIKMVRLYSHGREKNSNPATEPFAFHYLLRDLLALKYPEVGESLRALANPTRRAMSSILDFGSVSGRKLVHGECEDLIQRFPVVCCTLATSVNALMEIRSFDCVIIDEAAFSPEPETILGLKDSCRTVVLIGDPMQLPPVVQSNNARNSGYGTSMFERLMRDCGMEVTLLDMQYRMIPAISQFPRQMFYSGRLSDAPSVKSVKSPIAVAQYFANTPLILIECLGEELKKKNTFSFFNLKEAKTTTKVLKLLYQSGIPGSTIGVISPYDAQRRLLIEQTNQLNLGDWSSDVEIRSVDGYQGREKDVIVMSTVRSNPQHNIGFLRDHRRINVALTRAKFGIILIGNLPVLESNDIWRDFIVYARSVGEVRSVVVSD